MGASNTGPTGFSKPCFQEDDFRMYLDKNSCKLSSRLKTFGLFLIFGILEVVCANVHEENEKAPLLTRMPSLSSVGLKNMPRIDSRLVVPSLSSG